MSDDDMTTIAESGSTGGAEGPDRPSISVIVPAFNEAGVITATLTRLTEYLRGIEDKYSWEIVVVDDGSEDSTRALAMEFSVVHPRVRVLQHRHNFMMGQALRTAFNACVSDYLVVIDCDLSYGPEHIERLVDAIIASQAKVVIASPYMKGGSCTGVPLLRYAASRCANAILSLAASGRIKTLTGMVRAYDRRFVNALNLKAMGVEVNTEIIYKAQVLRALVEEIPAHLDWTAIRGLPRKSTVRLASGTIRSLLSAFIFRPFMFFIVPGLILALLGAGLVVSAWADGVSGGDDAHVAGIIGILMGGLLCSIGISALQAKRYFEELFHLGTAILREVRESLRSPPG
ncbi:MAG: glycosyltransferase family 2 protein [Acidimicrobiia bacterium]|nr:glycosyltransferase family 2 protein [Acidimicrobiia bacterium]